MIPSSRAMIVAAFSAIVNAAEWEFAPSCSGQMDISETLQYTTHGIGSRRRIPHPMRIQIFVHPTSPCSGRLAVCYSALVKTSSQSFPRAVIQFTGGRVIRWTDLKQIPLDGIVARLKLSRRHPRGNVAGTQPPSQFEQGLNVK